jgi:hypothetical protein
LALEWKYQPVVDKNSGLINPGTFIAKPKHFFGATNRDFRARVQVGQSFFFFFTVRTVDS